MPLGFIPPKSKIKTEFRNRNRSNPLIVARGKADSAKKGIQEVMSGFGGNIPPGADMTESINPSLRYPINQRLTDDERQTVASYRSLLPTIELIKTKMNSGILDDQNSNKGLSGNLERTARQAITDIGSPILSSKDDSLQGIQGDFNHLKSLLPFANGGKQLTGIEKGLVFKLLNITGKSNQQIETDLDRVVELFRQKEMLTVGGSNAIGQLNNSSSRINRPSKSPIPGMPSNNDPLGLFQ